MYLSVSNWQSSASILKLLFSFSVSFNCLYHVLLLEVRDGQDWWMYTVLVLLYHTGFVNQLLRGDILRILLKDKT